MAKQASSARPVIRHAKDITPEPIRWLWQPYIPRDMVVMLDGDPGLGKSTLLLQVATQLSMAWPFLDQLGKATLYADVEGPQHTLILSAEDSLEHVLLPRLQNAGADIGYIHFMNDWIDPKGTVHMFDLQHLPMLTQALDELKPVLVVLDPLVAYLGRIDMHRSNDTRPIMAALRQVAEAYHCTIIGVRHPSKLDSGGPLLYRGQGNVDIIGASRSALWVQKHPAHPETESLMIHSKTNVGMPGRSVIFSREQGNFQWKAVTRLTEPMFTGKGPDPFAFLDCFFWLEEYMHAGREYTVEEIDADAETHHFSHKILYRAKKALGVRLIQRAGPKYYNLLPPLSLSTTPDTTGSTGATGSTGVTGSTGSREPKSTTYDDPDPLTPLDPLTPVDPLDPVDPVQRGAIYACCGRALTHTQQVCFVCGKPRKAATG